MSQRYEIRSVAGSKAVLMRRLRDGTFVDEATFDSASSAGVVARILNAHYEQADA